MGVDGRKRTDAAGIGVSHFLREIGTRARLRPDRVTPTHPPRPTPARFRRLQFKSKRSIITNRGGVCYTGAILLFPLAV